MGLGHWRRAGREADIVARIGSDEFVVVQECPPDQTDLLAARLGHFMSDAITLDGATIVCGVSIGSVVAGPEHDAASLIAAADAAMYIVKRRRRSPDPEKTAPGPPSSDRPDTTDQLY